MSDFVTRLTAACRQNGDLLKGGLLPDAANTTVNVGDLIDLLTAFALLAATVRELPNPRAAVLAATCATITLNSEGDAI